jgi:ketosteroid isomerase-like protein
VISVRQMLFSALLVLPFTLFGANAATRSAVPPMGAGPASETVPTARPGAPLDAKHQVDEFNRRFVEACRRMDHKADAEFWADDGVDLLPGLEPMVGKATITHWLAGLAGQLRGAKMLDCNVDWREIRIEGDLAYEWGMNTQRIALPNRKEPIASSGKIVLILKREQDGAWKVELESWSQNPQRKPRR